LLVDAMRYHFPNVVNLITYAVTLKLAFESDPITVRAFKLPLTDPDTSVLVVLVREDRISSLSETRQTHGGHWLSYQLRSVADSSGGVDLHARTAMEYPRNWIVSHGVLKFLHSLTAHTSIQ